jgi:hypothetical protein
VDHGVLEIGSIPWRFKQAAQFGRDNQKTVKFEFVSIQRDGREHAVIQGIIFSVFKCPLPSFVDGAANGSKESRVFDAALRTNVC